jgi:D-tyrosyl-tRNA(Tyr) deacylase
MRALIQRVSKASVTIDGKVKSKIDKGLLILLGIEDADDSSDIEWLCSKISSLRIFSDEDDKMNLSILDINGDVIVVSQFTLHASTKKGNRPSYIKAARPEKAIPLYEEFLKVMDTKIDSTVASGEFGAMMDVELINDGPVTIMMDSKRRE